MREKNKEKGKRKKTRMKEQIREREKNEIGRKAQGKERMRKGKTDTHEKTIKGVRWMDRKTDRQTNR